LASDEADKELDFLGACERVEGLQAKMQEYYAAYAK